MITLLDYGAGNVRSVRNAVRKLGFEIQDAIRPEDILQAEKLIFPGVGNFAVVMQRLNEKGYIEPLRERILAGKPTFGICVALQAFFAGSDEAPGVAGLAIIPGQVRRFNDTRQAVPQIGWNNLTVVKDAHFLTGYHNQRVYFVHSYFAPVQQNNTDWICATTSYGETYISAICKGDVIATQFHPEKSGETGLNMLQAFLGRGNALQVGTRKTHPLSACDTSNCNSTGLAKRIIACLDVRSNDVGDLVVTKGDQYDVREAGTVRNLGKPVELAERYYHDGADEITFLNITGFRDFPLQDQPMLEVLKKTSENVFVPLTIGGGIREFTDSSGNFYSALDVASEYFRSGADKISIGSDAVLAAEKFLLSGHIADGSSAIEQISQVYGAQAVVISVDPRRVYVNDPLHTSHAILRTAFPGPNGEQYCWYQCTIKGGREGRDIDVVQLVTICQQLGAGEILLNCIDKDGSNSGYDLELISMVKSAISIPVIASSGAGKASHFIEVFCKTDVEAALAAGIFHRGEVGIAEVKQEVAKAGIPTR